jgi:hypothetical protein
LAGRSADRAGDAARQTARPLNIRFNCLKAANGRLTMGKRR